VCPCQQIPNRGVVPISASGCADAAVIQCLSDGAVGRRPSGLYLLDDGKDVGREGLGGPPICRHALGLRIMLAGIVGYEAKSPRIQEKQANLNIHS
jgi:hypothetical protein